MNYRFIKRSYNVQTCFLNKFLNIDKRKFIFTHYMTILIFTLDFKFHPCMVIIFDIMKTFVTFGLITYKSRYFFIINMYVLKTSILKSIVFYDKNKSYRCLKTQYFYKFIFGTLVKTKKKLAMFC